MAWYMARAKKTGGRNETRQLAFLFTQTLYGRMPGQADLNRHPTGQALQKQLEVREGSQAIGLGRFHDGVDRRAGVGALWRIGKQPVLPPHRKVAHSPLHPVVGQAPGSAEKSCVKEDK